MKNKFLTATFGLTLFATASFAQVGTDYALPPFPYQQAETTPAYEDSAPNMQVDAYKNNYAIALSPQQAAESALRQGQYAKARTLYAEVKQQGEPALAAYGTALSRAQEGDFVAALAALKNFPANTEYTLQATALKHQLLLTLAETAQLENKPTIADKWLREYYSATTGQEPSQRFVRLARAQGWEIRGAPEPVTGGHFRVGLLLPMSGKLAPMGNDLLRAAQLSLFSQHRDDIVLYPEDTEGTPEGTRAATNRLLQLGVDVIVGPLLAQNVDAASPHTRQSNVPLLALSSDARVAGHLTYLLGYLPADQARAAARHAASDGRSSFSALVPDNNYGTTVFSAFEEESSRLAIPLVRPTRFPADSVDISASLDNLLQLHQARARLQKELKQLEDEYVLLGQAMSDDALNRLKELRKAQPEALVEFDTLFIPAPARSMALISSQLAFHDVFSSDVRFIGTALWQDPALLQNGTEYLVGARFIAPPTTGANQFKRHFTTTFGNTANGPAILSYDAIQILSQLLDEAQGNSVLALANLTRPEGFSGLGGAFRLEESGLNTRAHDIFEITRKRGIKTIVASPALLPPALPQTITQEKGLGLRLPFFSRGTEDEQPVKEESKGGFSSWF